MDQALSKQESGIGAQLSAIRSRFGNRKQLWLIGGIAAALAVIAVMLLWTQSPSYRVLYSGLSEKEAGQVMEALQKSAIPYRIDGTSGALQVPAAQVHEARLKLAALGLPKGAGVGFEILDEHQTFGTSQFMEAARFQRALETELARSIATLSAVQNARVHLALPKQSVFVRDQPPPSASILLQLYPGRTLEPGQVAAMVHLIASSVPHLTTDRVTVVDQTGRLLTRDSSSEEVALSTAQLDYAKRVEASYIKRIEDILNPVVGSSAMRAQVTAEIDFSVKEQTEELFNPKPQGVRSEQVSSEQSVGTGAGGVPGALSNQPPPPATVPERVAPNGSQEPPQKVLNTSRREIRNFEIDKTISHTRSPSGAVRRLSVAVVIDDRIVKDDKGNPVRTPHSPEELASITALVKDAVGFSADRGDAVNITNASFAVGSETEPLGQPPIWEQPWVMEAIKIAVGALATLAVLFVVVRPLVQGLLKRGELVAPASKAGALVPRKGSLPMSPGADEQTLAEDRVSLSKGPEIPALTGVPDYETPLIAAKAMVEEDPSRAVQVLRSWLAADAHH